MLDAISSRGLFLVAASGKAQPGPTQSYRFSLSRFLAVFLAKFGSNVSSCTALLPSPDFKYPSFVYQRYVNCQGSQPSSINRTGPRWLAQKRVTLRIRAIEENLKPAKSRAQRDFVHLAKLTDCQRRQSRRPAIKIVEAPSSSPSGICKGWTIAISHTDIRSGSDSEIDDRLSGHPRRYDNLRH